MTLSIIADVFKALGITNKEVLDGFYESAYDPSLTTVKRVGNAGLGGYLVRYGATDLDGERFTSKTQYGVNDGDIVPVLFHHALFPEIGDIPIGHAKLRKSAFGIEIDPNGSALWLDDEFNEEEFLKLVFAKRKQYLETLAHIGWEKMKAFAKAVQKLIVSDAGMGWSSGCNPATVKRIGSEIVVWEVEEASITYSPAEPSNDVFVKMFNAENLTSGVDENVNADDRQQETISMTEQQAVADVQDVQGNEDQIIELIDFAISKAVAELRAEFQETIKSLKTESKEGTTVSAVSQDSTLLSRYQQRVAKSAIGRDTSTVVKSNTSYAKEEPKTSEAAKVDDVAGLNPVQFALRAVAQRGVN